MANWVYRGLAGGVVTTRYPHQSKDIPGAWPGIPAAAGGECPAGCRACLDACPGGAVDFKEGTPLIAYRRCIFCRRCVDVCPAGILTWRDDFRTAVAPECELPRRFSSRSVYIRHVDAGACECCLWEAGAVSHPFYDLNRLGFFFVTSPRHADLLLVSGPVTVNMAYALEKAYQAVPRPKKVVALGTCACGGPAVGVGYATPVPLPEVLPVDVFIPGCPPAPLTILHGLLLAAGRAEHGGPDGQMTAARR